jgi:hypothetical protein
MPNILDLPILSRIRRNHGLEHATLTTLARRFPGHAIGGYSDPGGCWIVGDLDTEAVTEAALEALERLHKGEKSLAVHPHCGTNYAVAGTLAGLAGGLVMLPAGTRRQKLERLPLAAVLATLALIAAQPLALLVQSRITTSGIPGTLSIIQVTRQEQGKLILHRIHTKG